MGIQVVYSSGAQNHTLLMSVYSKFYHDRDYCITSRKYYLSIQRIVVLNLVKQVSNRPNAEHNAYH